MDETKKNVSEIDDETLEEVVGGVTSDDDGRFMKTKDDDDSVFTAPCKEGAK